MTTNGTIQVRIVRKRNARVSLVWTRERDNPIKTRMREFLSSTNRIREHSLTDFENTFPIYYF